MRHNESVKSKVLAAIHKCGGNVSFDMLAESTKLSFIELSSIIGLLFKEKMLLIYPNLEKEKQIRYKSNA